MTCHQDVSEAVYGCAAKDGSPAKPSEKLSDRFLNEGALITYLECVYDDLGKRRPEEAARLPSAGKLAESLKNKVFGDLVDIIAGKSCY